MTESESNSPGMVITGVITGEPSSLTITTATTIILLHVEHPVEDAGLLAPPHRWWAT